MNKRIPAVNILFFIHVLVTITMTGIIWFIQLVHYPLLNLVGAAQFTTYEVAHTRLITWTVFPWMLIELGTGFLLLWRRPRQVTVVQAWIGFGLLLVIWASTVFLQVPQHHILALGFNAAAQTKLVATNWLRTVVWSVRTLLWLKVFSDDFNK